jgi:hypothetical protein
LIVLVLFRHVYGPGDVTRIIFEDSKKNPTGMMVINIHAKFQKNPIYGYFGTLPNGRTDATAFIGLIFLIKWGPKMEFG